MLVLKRLVTVLVMVYLLLVLLLVLSPGSRDSLMSVTAAGNATNFYYGLLLVGAVLLLLQLLTENLDSVLLRRDVASREGKINELKARLYDQQIEQRSPTTVGGTRTGTTVHPDGYVAPTPATPARPLPTDRDGTPLA